MNAPEILSEIRDCNMNYLVLAQQMLRSDRESAIFRLGLKPEVADILESLSIAQITKLAATNMMIMRFRMDDAAVLGMLTSYTKEKPLSTAQANILMAAQSITV